jgi:hypothetical protein
MLFKFSGAGATIHRDIGGDGLFQAAAAMILNSDHDAGMALRIAHAQMGLEPLQAAAVHPTEPAVQLVADHRAPQTPATVRS